MYHSTEISNITIAGRSFQGPFKNFSELEHKSGVYVIIGRDGNTDWNVIDVGESEDIFNRVSNHDRSYCWSNQGYNQLAILVYYTNYYDRINLEQKIRSDYTPPCGER